MHDKKNGPVKATQIYNNKSNVDKTFNKILECLQYKEAPLKLMRILPRK